MKQYILSIVLSVISLLTYAQSPQYLGAMQKNIATLDTTHSPQVLMELSNNFSRIANAETTQWLPFYYAGYCLAKSALLQPDKSKIDAMVDQAKILTSQADSLHPKSSEINCLRSMLATARLMVDPASRGMEYGPEAAQFLETAESINSSNPRPYLLQGESAFYTPAQWGGGMDIAKPLLQKAIEKFATFTPKSSIDPHWGKMEAQYFLSKIKQ